MKINEPLDVAELNSAQVLKFYIEDLTIGWTWKILLKRKDPRFLVFIPCCWRRRTVIFPHFSLFCYNNAGAQYRRLPEEPLRRRASYQLSLLLSLLSPVSSLWSHSPSPRNNQPLPGPESQYHCTASHTVRPFLDNKVVWKNSNGKWIEWASLQSIY